jgi:hypothetical protein
MVTVPCCEICRKGQPLDDEYFVRMVALRQDLANHSVASRVLASVQRSLANPRQRGFLNSLLRSLKQVPLQTPTGIYVGTAGQYDVDLPRLCRVVERTTRGLYYHEFKERLPDTYRCQVYALDGFARPGGQLPTEAKQLFKAAATGEAKALGGDAYVYSFQRVPPREHVSIWLHLVYRRVAFVALTIPKNGVAGGAA